MRRQVFNTDPVAGPSPGTLPPSRLLAAAFARLLVYIHTYIYSINYMLYLYIYT